MDNTIPAPTNGELEQERRDALRHVLDGARELADGEAVDAYNVLDAAVEAFLRGDDADAISAAGFIH
jgi:hypothetical protein